jgi:hypothetical protein
MPGLAADGSTISAVGGVRTVPTVWQTAHAMRLPPTISTPGGADR